MDFIKCQQYCFKKTMSRDSNLSSSHTFLIEFLAENIILKYFCVPFTASDNVSTFCKDRASKGQGRRISQTEGQWDK